MLQWFIRFPEFAEITEFNESYAPFRKNSNNLLYAIPACTKKYLLIQLRLPPIRFHEFIMGQWQINDIESNKTTQVFSWFSSY